MKYFKTFEEFTDNIPVLNVAILASYKNYMENKLYGLADTIEPHVIDYPKLDFEYRTLDSLYIMDDNLIIRNPDYSNRINYITHTARKLSSSKFLDDIKSTYSDGRIFLTQLKKTNNAALPFTIHRYEIFLIIKNNLNKLEYNFRETFSFRHKRELYMLMYEIWELTYIDILSWLVIQFKYGLEYCQFGRIVTPQIYDYEEAKRLIFNPKEGKKLDKWGTKFVDEYVIEYIKNDPSAYRALEIILSDDAKKRLKEESKMKSGGLI